MTVVVITVIPCTYLRSAACPCAVDAMWRIGIATRSAVCCLSTVTSFEFFFIPEAKLLRGLGRRRE